MEATVADFVRTWHGNPPPDAGYANEEIPEFVPQPLRAFYRTAGKWPGVVAQNQLLAPNELRGDGGRLVFYIENQAVFLWATEPGEDPAVWGRRNEPGARWQIEGEPLSRFLLQMVMFEAVMGADAGASVAWLDSESVGRVLADMDAFPYAPWQWPDYPTRFYSRGGVLTVVAPNRTFESDDHVSLYIGARDDDELRFLEPHVTDDWEFFTPWG